MSKFVYEGPITPETTLEEIPVLFPDSGVKWLVPVDKGIKDTFFVKDPGTGELTVCEKESGEKNGVYISAA